MEKHVSPWRKVALVAAGAVAVVVLIGGVLTLFGVRPVTLVGRSRIGSAECPPLFEERNSVGGVVLVTASDNLERFNAQSFFAGKSPRTTRVFCVGGSTTYGWPFDDTTSFCGYLRETLRRAEPGRRWDVINAGGVGSGSCRIVLLMEELVRYKPDAFIVYCGHSEFLADSHSGESLLDNPAGPAVCRRDDAKRKRTLERYETNLRRIIKTARAAGAKVILVTPASNFAGCPPFKSVRHEGITREELERVVGFLSKAVKAYDSGADYSRTALKAYEAACAIDPRDAQAQFARGEFLLGLERYAEAAEAFKLARDEDVCPLRALSAQQNTVRDVARETGVFLLDFQKVVAACSPNDIPGDTFFLDHVHLKSEGNILLAAELLRTMVDARLVTLPEGWGDADVAAAAVEVSNRVRPVLRGQGHFRLGKMSSWAGRSDEAIKHLKVAASIEQELGAKGQHAPATRRLEAISRQKGNTGD